MKPKAMFTGRITRNVTSIYKNDDGSAKRALFTVACNSVYKDAAQQKVKQCDFIPCIAWGKHADLLETWGLKGRLVSIVGTIESYQKPPDGDGKYEPTKIQVRVAEIEFLAFEDNVREKMDAQKTASAQAGPAGTANPLAGLNQNDILKALQTMLLGGAQPQQAATNTATDTATPPADLPEYEGAMGFEDDVPY